MKKRLLSAIAIAVLIAIVLTGCTGAPISMFPRKITLENGSRYRYWPVSDTDSDYWINGINLSKGTKKEIQEALTDSIPSYTPTGKITTSKQAAFCGATALELTYEEWTQANFIAIDYNDDTDIWLVHGQLESRESPVIPLGVVALDGSTGEVIAIGLDTHTDCD